MDFHVVMVDSSTMSVAEKFTACHPALRAWFVVTLLCASLSAASGDSLIGRKAPEWSNAVWLNSAPLQLPQLAGKVVLIRWWTAPGCPYCRATAPALNEFHETYRERGLEVIGFYHHKSPERLDVNEVKEHARRFGFKFPIAIDPEWQTLKQWWLNSDAAKWTSVSFLLDRHGVVRHIHPGGQYVKGDEDNLLLRSKIEALLAEK